MAVLSKYELYERSVQEPKANARWFAEIYRDVRGRDARTLREDFCGTFALSCAWVRQNRENKATAIDISREPLSYGRSANLSRLTADERKRIQIIRGDVAQVRPRPADFIIAGNFSFYVFQKRAQLIKYFENCRRGLNSRGILLLEMAGGPGMIEDIRDRRKVGTGRKKGEKFTYVWDQKSFDPIQRRGLYGISFKLPSGKLMRDAFTYDWRLWTIPEVRDVLADAGFKKTVVLWETEHKNVGTGEYFPSESGDNAFSWIAYVLGVR